MPFPQRPHQLHKLSCPRHHLFSLPPPSLLLQLKTLPCGNCRLTLPSGASLAQKRGPSLYFSVGGNHTQWECAYLPDTSPILYPEFSYVL